MAIGDDFNGPGRSEPAPARHHEPFQKTSFFEKGSWCRRAAAGRAAGGAARGPTRITAPDRAPRTSHKLVGSWGAPGPPIGTIYPPVSYGGGRCPYHRWVLRRPNSGALSTRAPGPFGPRWSQRRSGKFGRGTGRPRRGGLQMSLGKRDFSTIAGSYLASELRRVLIDCVPQAPWTAPDLSRITSGKAWRTTRRPASFYPVF